MNSQERLERLLECKVPLVNGIRIPGREYVEHCVHDDGVCEYVLTAYAYSSLPEKIITPLFGYLPSTIGGNLFMQSSREELNTRGHLTNMLLNDSHAIVQALSTQQKINSKGHEFYAAFHNKDEIMMCSTSDFEIHFIKEFQKRYQYFLQIKHEVIKKKGLVHSMDGPYR